VINGRDLQSLGEMFQVVQNANAKPERTMAEQKDLEKPHAQDHREIKTH
jgi:hypothetical protein